MKLSTWARQAGVHPVAAYRWFHAGALPVAARQRPTGTILVDPPTRNAAKVAVYARVSSADQRADLDRQVARLAAVATAAGLAPWRLVADPDVTTVVVEHRDRLARFGVEYVEAAMPLMQRRGSGLELAAHGRRIVVLDGEEVADDLVGDMVEVGTAMCARLYGRRSALGRAERAVEAAGEASA